MYNGATKEEEASEFEHLQICVDALGVLRRHVYCPARYWRAQVNIRRRLPHFFTPLAPPLMRIAFINEAIRRQSQISVPEQVLSTP